MGGQTGHTVEGNHTIEKVTETGERESACVSQRRKKETKKRRERIKEKKNT